MPRAFTEEERERLRGRLLEVGRRHFARYGLQKTGVADLAREAGISKGAFYLFFPSKEVLFFEVLEAVQAEVRAPLEEALKGAQPPREVLRRFLRERLRTLEREPLLRLLTQRSELEALLARLPPEVLARHRGGDEAFLLELFKRWRRQGLMPRHSPRVALGLLTALIAVAMQKDLVGEDVFDEVLGRLVDLVCDSLFVEEGRR